MAQVVKKPRKTYNLICQACGQTFTAGAAHAKWCVSCRKIQKIQMVRAWYRQKHAQPAPKKGRPCSMPGDHASPEEIALCTHCKRTACPGECDAIFQFRNKKYQARIHSVSDAEILRLQEDGLSQRQIAERLGCSRNTVSRHLQEMRGGGSD